MRYDVREDTPLGTWCVWDRQRGQIATSNGAPWRDMTRRDAAIVARNLNAEKTPDQQSDWPTGGTKEDEK